MRNGTDNAYVVIFILYIVSTSFIALAYSPLLGFYVPLVYLIFNFGKDFLMRFLLAAISILGACFTFSSRNYVSGTINDDFANVYLPAFYDVSKGGSIFYEQFSGGVEFFITAYFKLISFFFEVSRPNVIMFFTLFLVLVLFYIWIECFVLKNLDSNKRSLCLATCFSLMAVIVITQNMRQAISCVFLLYAVSFFLNKKITLFIIFWLMAIVSHTTAILVLPLSLTIMKGSKRLRLVLIFTCVGISVLFNVVIAFLISHNLLGSSTYKLLYYSDTSGVSVDIGYMKFLLISIVASYLFFDKNDINKKEYKNLLYYGSLIYLILIPIPTLPFRIMMLLVVFYNGLLMFYSFYKKNYFFVLILLCYNTYKFVTLGPYQNLIEGGGAYMNLWWSYPWAGTSFFYYVL